MKLITSSTPVCVATYESGAFLCQISPGVGSGARLEHVCITHHLNILLILYYHIYTTFSFHATILSKIKSFPFIAAPCTRQCIYDASNRNHGFPQYNIVGPWADYWGHSRHVSPRRYKKRDHGRILGDFFLWTRPGADFRAGAFTGIAGNKRNLAITHHAHEGWDEGWDEGWGVKTRRPKSYMQNLTPAKIRVNISFWRQKDRASLQNGQNRRAYQHWPIMIPSLSIPTLTHNDTPSKHTYIDP